MNRKDLKKILSITIEDEVGKVALEFEEKLAEISDRIRKVMEEKEIFDLYELFINYDHNHEGYLSFDTLL